ncbi:hypothetical protein THAOC_04922, partial [Thalassiosira oceanica]
MEKRKHGKDVNITWQQASIGKTSVNTGHHGECIRSSKETGDADRAKTPPPATTAKRRGPATTVMSVTTSLGPAHNSGGRHGLEPKRYVPGAPFPTERPETIQYPVNYQHGLTIFKST